MEEIIGDIWDYQEQIDSGQCLLCIPTNAIVRSDNTAVMGVGIAAQVKARYPGIERALGTHMVTRGSPYGGPIKFKPEFFSFPTKRNFRNKADIELIKWSTRLLSYFLKVHRTWREEKMILLPRPGCGAGRLDYETEVKELLWYLPDCVKVIDNEQQEEARTIYTEESGDISTRDAGQESSESGAEYSGDASNISQDNGGNLRSAQGLDSEYGEEISEV